VGLEIITYSREHACISGFGADGLEVVLRSGAWEELIYYIIDEERGEEDETRLVELVIAEKQVERHCTHHHIIVGVIAQIERFAPKSAAEKFTEEECRLASKELVVHIGKDVVEIRILTAIFVGLGIPNDKASKQR